MQVLDAAIQERTMSLMTAILERNAIAAEVTPTARLVDIGLTSMDMVSLMLGVEAEFDFTIPQSEITPENFQSVETLQRMIAGQFGPARAALAPASFRSDAPASNPNLDVPGPVIKHMPGMTEFCQPFCFKCRLKMA